MPFLRTASSPLFCGLWLAAGAALAQAAPPVPAPVMPPPAVAADASAPPRPAVRSEGSVRWTCGGIGSDESTAMRAAMRSHPLSLLFARTDGAYLSAVDVQIEGGASARLRAGGPVCLVDLPAGQYTVVASSEGVTRRQTVTVGGEPRTVDFRF